MQHLQSTMSFMLFVLVTRKGSLGPMHCFLQWSHHSTPRLSPLNGMISLIILPHLKKFIFVHICIEFFCQFKCSFVTETV